jgi:hypothetical protein
MLSIGSIEAIISRMEEEQASANWPNYLMRLNLSRRYSCVADWLSSINHVRQACSSNRNVLSHINTSYKPCSREIDI